MLQYLESCSRFEKTVDTRLKEMRLMRASVREDPAAATDDRTSRSTSASKGRQKKEEDKRRHLEKTQVKERSSEPRTKSRLRKTARNNSFVANDVELTKSQAEYFLAVERVRQSKYTLNPFWAEL